MKKFKDFKVNEENINENFEIFSNIKDVTVEGTIEIIKDFTNIGTGHFKYDTDSEIFDIDFSLDNDVTLTDDEISDIYDNLENDMQLKITK